MWRTGVLSNFVVKFVLQFLLDIRYLTQYYAGNYRIRIKRNVSSPYSGNSRAIRYEDLCPDDVTVDNDPDL